MKNLQKGLITLVSLIVITVLIIGGGLYSYKKYNQSSATEMTDTFVAPSSNQYLGWKTYTNTVYNYSIKYPSDWYINTTYSNQDFTPRGSAPSAYIGGDTSISNYSDSYMNDYHMKNGDLAQPADYFIIILMFTKLNSNLSLADYLSDPSFSKPNTTENVVINGTPGIKSTYLNITGIGGNTKLNQIGIDLKRDNEIISIGYGFDTSVESIVPVADKIINSFTLSN